MQRQYEYQSAVTLDLASGQVDHDVVASFEVENGMVAAIYVDRVDGQPWQSVRVALRDMLRDALLTNHADFMLDAWRAQR